MRFEEKVNQFLKDATPIWHITYHEVSHKLLGIHPRDPRSFADPTQRLSICVKLIDDDQLPMVEEILDSGINNYEVDKATLKIKPRDRSRPANDFGDFVRIEYVPSFDHSKLDAALSIMLEPKIFRVKLISDAAKAAVIAMLSTAEEDPKLRFYITEYNSPNKLIHPIVISVRSLAEQKELDVEFDGADLPQDISIYYIKVFNTIEFEVQ